MVFSLLKPNKLFSSAKKNKKNIGLISVVFLVVIAASFFAWRKYGQKQFNKMKGNITHASNKEIIKSDESAIVYYFYTEWCPYCKKAKPEWEKFKDVYSKQSVNGYNLEFKEVDADKDEETATKFKVEGYPTIKLIKDGTIVEYDAKPKFETLEKFVKSSL